MILEFNHKKSSITFGGGKFVCLFDKKGLVNKSLKISVFEADDNFRPINPRVLLYSEEIPLDERKIFPTLRIISAIDEGKARWIPTKYLDKANTKEANELEETACAMAFGFTDHFIKKKDYSSALMNINASLFSKYLKSHPRLESRLLKLQSSAWAGTNNFSEAKKSYLRAIEVYKESDSHFDQQVLEDFDRRIHQSSENT